MVKKEVLAITAIFVIIFYLGLSSSAEITSTSDVTVCCEETNSGLFCQDVPETECKPGSRTVPTSCETTSYCSPGYCFDSSEGTCLDNTPQLVCNENGGVWSEEEPPQCSLGCCTLGDQAAFVTLTRCKKLSADLGLLTSFNSESTSEVQCILSVAGQEKGACVYDFEFERTCRFTTRAECSGGVSEEGAEVSGGEFYSGKLCSAEELSTNCGPTTDTICAPGKEEVYFVDSCGNPANIYDASKANDKEYWSNVKTKEESCAPGSDNAGNPNCGNCNYLAGSFCRDADLEGRNPRYGENICANLNCQDTVNGQDYKHGESWCVYNDAGEPGNSQNPVGSRFYKHICINGEEVVEACADFRQEECIQNIVENSGGEFSQAACRVNRWQDCATQGTQVDCENQDRRDCTWVPGEFNVVFANLEEKGVCIPTNSPGVNFWDSGQTLRICQQANAQCIVSYEKGLFGGDECVENCHCLLDSWEEAHALTCQALGDCGPKINWAGSLGSKKGFKISITSVEEE